MFNGDEHVPFCRGACRSAGDERYATLSVESALSQKLRGHYGYYGRKGNRAQLWKLRRWVVLEWWRWLRRRSQRGLSWEAMTRLLQRYPPLEPSRACPA